MDDFERMLSGAIEKGKAEGRKSERAAAAAKMSQEELKRLHSKYRLHLSDVIEKKNGTATQSFSRLSIRNGVW